MSIIDLCFGIILIPIKHMRMGTRRAGKKPIQISPTGEGRGEVRKHESQTEEVNHSH